MTQVEQIKAEIERLKEKYRPLIWSEDPEKSKEGGYKIEALNELMLSLPEEQPSEDLDKAAEEYANSVAQFDMQRIYSKDDFKAGARWMARQMMKDAQEGFIFQSADYYPKELIARYYGYLKMGNKVKLIIFKENEK